jgi:multicomponent Na+:H+ antiporter subunit B
MKARPTAPISVLAALFAFAWVGRGLLGLPQVGNYPGPYGDTVAVGAVRERHVPEAVTAVVFDYRGFDTLLEEFILFTSVTGIAVLLRGDRPGHSSGSRLRPFGGGPWETVRVFGPLPAAWLGVYGGCTILHGHLSAGGGFQGGVIIATAIGLAAFCSRFPFFRDRPRRAHAHAAEALGVGAYVLLGMAMTLAGGAFLENRISLGVFGDAISGGTLPVLNVLAGLAVAGAFIRLIRRLPVDLQDRAPGEET